MRAPEALMQTLGIERYRQKFQRAVDRDKLTESASGYYLLQQSFQAFHDAFVAWWNNEGKNRTCWDIRATLQGILKPEEICFIVAKEILDRLLAVNQFKTLSRFVGNSLMLEMQARELKKQDPSVWNDLAHKLRWSSESTKKKSFTRMTFDQKHYFTVWDKHTVVRVGAFLVELFRESTGLIDVTYKKSRSGRWTAFGWVTAQPDVLQWLEKSNEYHEMLSPVWLPLPTEPHDWTGFYCGGYDPEVSVRLSFVKVHDKKAKDYLGPEQIPEVYDAVNHMQKTAWEINPNVLKVLEAVWERGHPVAGLPPREDEPLPTISEDASEEELSEHKMMLREIHASNREARSRRLLFIKILWVAKKHADVRPLYFPHKLDARGRAYPVPLFLNPQGPDVAKGLLRFHEAKPVDAQAVYWLKVHGANCWGLDKEDFETRVKWVDENLDLFRGIVHDPFKRDEWMGCDSPWQFLAWCHDYTMALDEGYSRVPVSFDGRNNGLQILGAAIRCPQTAKLVCLEPSNKPEDIYSDVANHVTGKLKLLAEQGEAYASRWMDFMGPGGIPRAAVKRQVMTQPYGSTMQSCHQYTLEWARGEDSSNINARFPKEVFRATRWLGTLIWDAIKETIVGPRRVMDWFRKVADICGKERVELEWSTDTGFRVKQNYPHYRSREVVSRFGPKMKICIYDRVPKKFLGKNLQNRNKNKQAIVANWVHSLDAAAMIRTVTLCKQAGIGSLAMVHDSFGTHAADADKLYTLLRQAYVQILDDDLIGNFAREIQAKLPDGVELPPPPKLGDFDVRKIQDSPYFFA